MADQTTAEVTALDEAAIRRFYRNLGARVRTGRQHAGLTQLQLSEKLGITRSSIANFEAGRQRPPIHLLALTLEICGIPATDLITGPSMWEQSDSFFNLEQPLAAETESSRLFVEATLRSLGGPEVIHVEG